MATLATAPNIIERPSSMTWLPVLAGALLAAVFAVLTPVGLPYDEPAHWANVQFYATRLRLPVLGEPFVYYEGQQTPIYYMLAAVPVIALGPGTPMALYAARLVGVAGFVVMLVAVRQLLLRVFRASGPVAVAVLVLALNPMFLAMAGSVQNDTWSLAFGFLLMSAALRSRHPAVLGALAALATLTKISVLPLVVASLLFFAWRRRRWLPISCAGAIFVLPVAAWAARNRLLYGDWTGQAGVVRTGVSFGTEHLGLATLAQSVATYLTIPTEYFRNMLVSPTTTDLASIAFLGLLAMGFFAGGWRRRGGSVAMVLLWGVGVLSVAAWFAEHQIGWPVAFRTAYGVLPLVAWAGGRLVGPAALSRVMSALLFAVELILLGWVLLSLPGLPRQPLLAVPI